MAFWLALLKLSLIPVKASLYFFAVVTDRRGLKKMYLVSVFDIRDQESIEMKNLSNNVLRSYIITADTWNDSNI